MQAHVCTHVDSKRPVDEKRARLPPKHVVPKRQFVKALQILLCLQVLALVVKLIEDALSIVVVVAVIRRGSHELQLLW